MAFDEYDIDPEGAYVLRDSGTGETFRSAPIPYVQEFARGLKRRRAPVELGEFGDEPAAPPPPAQDAPEFVRTNTIGTIGQGRGLVPEGAMRRGNLPERRPESSVVAPPPAAAPGAGGPPKPAPDPGRAVHYQREEDGGFLFYGANGTSWRSDDTRAAQELARSLDSKAMHVPDEPGVVEDRIVYEQSPTMRLRLASDPMAAAENEPVPTPPPGQPAPAPEPASPAAAGDKPKIVRGAPDLPPTPAEAAANLLIQDAEDDLRGSPPQWREGGTVPTGMTVQRAAGPDPRATADRERAERRAANPQSDLIHVKMRESQELAEHNERQADMAAERASRLLWIQAREKEKLDEVYGRIEQTQRDLADAKVDPNRLVNGMSTGRRIAAAIAMGLGIMGKAFTGGPGNPMAMDVYDEAIRDDIEDQKYAIEKKRGDLNALGQVYQLALSKFGNEKMATEAAYLAGLEIIRAKVQRTMAEAEAAGSMDASGAPYSIKAKAHLADLDVRQAQIRESLSQASNGQVAQQFVTTQSGWVGGKTANREAASKKLARADELLGGAGQTVTVTNEKGVMTRYRLGRSVEAGEGKALREKLVNTAGMKRDVVELIGELKDSTTGLALKTYNKSKVDGLIKRINSALSVKQGQGSQTDPEAEQGRQILSGVLTGGLAAAENLHRWVIDQEDQTLNQLHAKPADQAGAKLPPRVAAAARGEVIPKGTPGGVGGPPRGAGGGAGGAAGGAPPGAVVRSTGARATPLDVAQASLLQIGKDRRAEQATLNALGEALHTGQLGPREYEVAVDMLKGGQVGELRGFLSRMADTIDVSSLGRAPRDPYMAMIGQRAAQATPAPRGRVTTSIKVTTKGGK